MSPDRQTVYAEEAPAALGPYSHAVKAGNLLFCSGQIPLDPSTGELVGSSPAEQAEQCLNNLQAVCMASGTILNRAIKVTIYVTDMAQFAAINEVYGQFFVSDHPARLTIGVAQLPMGAEVEIEAIVAL